MNLISTTIICKPVYTKPLPPKHLYVVLRSELEREAAIAEAERLLTWCRLLVTHLQPLPQLLLSSGHLRSCDSHMTRLSLHVHWTSIAVTYRLAPLVGWRWFLEQCSLTLSCLLSHAASIPLSSSSPCPSSLPGCVCLRGLWILIRHSLDNSPVTSFWTVLSSLVCQTITPTQPHPSDEPVLICPSDPVLFGWWCVEQVSQLYVWTEDGREKEGDGGFVPHWDLVHHLLPLTFKQGVREAQLRMALKGCVSLAHVWPPASSLPCLSAWEFFHRHIDDQFVTGTAAISEWASPEGSLPSRWFRHLVSIFRSTNTQSHSHTDLNSFQLFLQLICVTMETSDDEGRTWRSLKGRFYSKIHRRWLGERKGAGLQRVLSLLLSLAWAGDSREVALKTVALLTHSGLAEAVESSVLFWRAMFAMMLVLLEKKERLDDVIAKLQPALSSLVKPHPPESRDHQWKAVGVVLDGTVEVIESGLELRGRESDCTLTGTHFSDLLTSCEGAHLTRVLGVVESMCTLLSSSSSPAVNQLWVTCSQPLMSLSRLPLPPSSLSSTLAALTALTSHRSHTHNFSNTLYQEITRDNVSPLLAAAYLGHVIENDVIRHHILSTDKAQLQALHIWFRCLAELDHTPSATPTGRSSLFLLTQQLPKLPMVSSLLGNKATPSDPIIMLKLLLEAMETLYSIPGLEGEWRERLRIVLGDVTHYLEPSVSGARGPSAIRHAYFTAGLVVSMAPRLTYSRTDSRCLLPRLLDWLILPLSSSSSHSHTRPQPQGAASAARANLHLFLTGLLKLGPVRDDFVKRKVKQLFSRYFHDCCQPRSPLLPPSQNPFLLALRPWFGTSYQGDGEEELGLIMEVVASQALSLPQPTSSLSPTLKFIKNVVERVQRPSLLVTMAIPLIGHMTSCLLSCDVCTGAPEPPGIRRLVMDILTPLLTACRDHQDHLLPCSSLLPPLTNYLSCNYWTIDHTHLTTPLKVIKDLYPDLWQLLVSHLTQHHHLNSLITLLLSS
ncbi:Protein MMS22-like [Geodia barretti]|uniref:Protein MMS22-like n=2 Tax=Geodia barretti TaxID=519541 RepID=A0AA35TC67_GEOBA|nr:Protein MMS22-like [Geodia barretti]